MLDKKGLNNIFKAAYGLADNEATSKLSRGRLLFSKYKIPPRECLLIGDSSHDFEVANQLGSHALIVADGHQAFESLSHLSCKVLKSKYTL